MQSPTEYYSDKNNASNVQITKVIFPCKSYGLHPSGIVLCVSDTACAQGERFSCGPGLAPCLAGGLFLMNLEKNPF